MSGTRLVEIKEEEVEENEEEVGDDEDEEEEEGTNVDVTVETIVTTVGIDVLDGSTLATVVPSGDNPIITGANSAGAGLFLKSH